VALELAITIDKPGGVALVNMANDKRPGGDWEAGWSNSLIAMHCYARPNDERGSGTGRVHLQKEQSRCNLEKAGAER